VWARGRVGVEECPKSLVEAWSVEMVERFWLWKFSGGAIDEMAARDADAILILENEWRTEIQ